MPITLNIDVEVLQNEKIQTQFTFLVKAIDDLYTCLKENKDELFVNSLFSAVLYDPHLANNAQAIIGRTESVLNNISGTVSGYHKELQLAFKQSRKAMLDGSTLRTVHFGARGDVAVDYGEGFGKAIQSKSSFADGNADINTMIKTAANQLTGERVAKETPNAKDRRIIDLSIMNPKNPWPRSNLFGNQPFSLQEVESKVHELVSEYVKHNSVNPATNTKQGGKGYNKFGELTPNLGTAVGAGNSGNLTSKVTGTDPFGKTAIGIDLVVKIRYNNGRPFLINGQAKLVSQITTRTELNTHTNMITTQCVLCKHA